MCKGLSLDIVPRPQEGGEEGGSVRNLGSFSRSTEPGSSLGGGGELHLIGMAIGPMTGCRAPQRASTSYLRSSCS